MKNDPWNFGQRVKIIEPGPLFGQTGTIVRDPDPDPDTIEEFYDICLPIKLDNSEEIVYCREPWGQFDCFLERI